MVYLQHLRGGAFCIGFWFGPGSLPSWPDSSLEEESGPLGKQKDGCKSADLGSDFSHNTGPVTLSHFLNRLGLWAHLSVEVCWLDSWLQIGKPKLGIRMSKLVGSKAMLGLCAFCPSLLRLLGPSSCPVYFSLILLPAGRLWRCQFITSWFGASLLGHIWPRHKPCPSLLPVAAFLGGGYNIWQTPWGTVAC